MADGAARVRHVVHEDGHLALGIADEDHGGDLVGALPLLVDEGELDVEPVGDGRHPLGAARVRGDDDGVPPVLNVLLMKERSAKKLKFV